MTPARLIIIEAPGKLSVVRRSAAQVWPRETTLVLATGGVLQDLVSDALGVNLHTWEAENMVPSKQGPVFWASLDKWRATLNAKQTLTIWVMTDPDREGEGIAKTLLDGLQARGLQKHCYRAYTLDTSPEGLKHAQITRGAHEGMVVAQRARRVLDRVIPYLLKQRLKTTSWQGLGRVQIPALKVAKDITDHWNKWRVEGWVRGPKGWMPVNFKTSDEAFAKASAQALRELDWGKVLVKSERVVMPPPPIHTTGTLLSAVPLTPDVAMRGLQEGYMAGRIGYPRSDLAEWTPQIQKNVRNMAGRMHLRALLKQNEDEDGATGGSGSGMLLAYGKEGHPGLHPTEMAMTPPGPEYSKDALRVEQEIAARSMAQTLQPAEFIRHTVVVDVGFRWLDLEYIDVQQFGWTRAYERMGLPNPVLPMPPMQKDPPHVVERFPTGRDLVREMVSVNLARPSTLAMVHKKLQESAWLSPFGTLTTEGERVLLAARKLAPDMLQQALTQRIEDSLRLLVEHPDRYTDVVISTLLASGFHTEELAQLAQATKIYAPDPEWDRAWAVVN